MARRKPKQNRKAKNTRKPKDVWQQELVAMKFEPVVRDDQIEPEALETSVEVSDETGAPAASPEGADGFFLGIDALDELPSAAPVSEPLVSAPDDALTPTTVNAPDAADAPEAPEAAEDNPVTAVQPADADVVHFRYWPTGPEVFPTMQYQLEHGGERPLFADTFAERSVTVPVSEPWEPPAGFAPERAQEAQQAGPDVPEAPLSLADGREATSEVAADATAELDHEMTFALDLDTDLAPEPCEEPTPSAAPEPDRDEAEVTLADLASEEFALNLDDAATVEDEPASASAPADESAIDLSLFTDSDDDEPLPVREKHAGRKRFADAAQTAQPVYVNVPAPVLSVSLPPVPAEWSSQRAQAPSPFSDEPPETLRVVESDERANAPVPEPTAFDEPAQDEAPEPAAQAAPLEYIPDRKPKAKTKAKRKKEPMFTWRGKPIGASAQEYEDDEPEYAPAQTQPAAPQRKAKSSTKDVEAENWLKQSIDYALSEGASDLQLSQDGRSGVLTARIRVDGTMRHLATINPPHSNKIVGLFRVESSISSAGAYIPEESTMNVVVDGEERKARNITFRDATGGSVAVLRLPPTGPLRRLEDLELDPSNLELFERMLASANKLTLIAGPMGSGKTTTAHAALLRLASPERSVWTLEDPVERDLPGLTQLEIDEANGATFEKYLPALVRSDYDTLFLGEIRDTATAAAATRQAKAGRQIISTIHANNNVTALLRLIELAKDSPLSVLDGVLGVISQRLVRRLNPNWDGVTPSEKYKGRVPIHEVLLVDDNIIELIMRDAPLSQLKASAEAASQSTFERDSKRLVNAGITDWAEIYRVLGHSVAAE